MQEPSKTNEGESGREFGSQCFDQGDPSQSGAWEHALRCSAKDRQTSLGPGLSPPFAGRSEEEAAKDVADCCADCPIFLFLSDGISVYPYT